MPETSTIDLHPIELFAAYYLQDDLKLAVPPFHRDMYELAGQGHRRIAICAPRSFAKSIVFSKIYCTYMACTKRAKRIILLSATGSLARHWLKEIKYEIEHNEFIRDDDPNSGRGFGNLVGDVWTQDEIKITHPDGFVCEIMAKGAGFQIRGFRPDLLIVDDLEDDEQIRSEDQRHKIKDWFNKAVINTLEPDAQMIVVGTRISPLALLSQILERPGYVTRRYKAIVYEGGDMWSGRPLWPEKWPLDELKERHEEIGHDAFMSEYMDEPLTAQDPLFFNDWIQWYDPTQARFQADRNKGFHTIISVDPAISKASVADDTCITVWSATHEPDPIYYCQESLFMHGASPERTADAALSLYYKHGGNEIAVETNAYQQALLYEFKRFADNNHRYATIIPVVSSTDKVVRARGCQSFFERRRCFFNEHDKSSKRLVDQLLQFPDGDRDDGVDSTSLAFGRFRTWRYFPKNRGKLTIVLPGRPRAFSRAV